MNISTYESRIKALEDQLNPPAPSATTGIMSAVVTPDIQLEDGTTINAKLAALMPIASGDSQRLNASPASPLTESANYTVTITPGSAWYGGVSNEIGAQGEPVSAPIQITTGKLTFVALAMEDPEDEAAPYSQLRVQVGFQD